MLLSIIYSLLFCNFSQNSFAQDIKNRVDFSWQDETTTGQNAANLRDQFSGMSPEQGIKFALDASYGKFLKARPNQNSELLSVDVSFQYSNPKVTDPKRVRYYVAYSAFCLEQSSLKEVMGYLVAEIGAGVQNDKIGFEVTYTSPNFTSFVVPYDSIPADFSAVHFKMHGDLTPRLHFNVKVSDGKVLPVSEEDKSTIFSAHDTTVQGELTCDLNHSFSLLGMYDFEKLKYTDLLGPGGSRLESNQVADDFKIGLRWTFPR